MRQSFDAIRLEYEVFCYTHELVISSSKVLTLSIKISMASVYADKKVITCSSKILKLIWNIIKKDGGFVTFSTVSLLPFSEKFHGQKNFKIFYKK